jgi:mono/diheme cytochrome c family protein
MAMQRVKVWRWSALLLAALLFVFWAHRREAPERLPSPLQASNGTCVSARCHAGMDDPHRTDMLRCVDCHGGNPNVPEPKTDDPKAWLAMMRRAHVAMPKGVTAKQMGIVAFLDRLPSDYIRFVNPSDLRVAERTCGQAECHGILRGDVVRRVKRSLHATLSGYSLLAAQLGESAETFGIHSITAWKPTTTAGAVNELRHFWALKPSSLASTLLGNCVQCHIQAYPPQPQKGAFRASGCAACHMPYADDGKSETAHWQPLTGAKRSWRNAHPFVHAFLARPDDTEQLGLPKMSQCRHCHTQGMRVQQNFIGEHGETDIHFQRGMICSDCHTDADMHGDGNLYMRQGMAVEIRCESCHGIVDHPATMRTANGRPVPNLRRLPDGKFVLRTHDQRLRFVPQVIDTLDPAKTPKAAEAHGRSGIRKGVGVAQATLKGFSHLDRLECSACHMGGMFQPLRGHFLVDKRRSVASTLTGTPVASVTQNFPSEPPPQLLLGINHRGRIAPFIAHPAALVIVNPDGTKAQRLPVSLLTNRPARTFLPLAPHSVTKTALACRDCHFTPDRRNASAVRRAVGLGTNTVDRLTTADGKLIADFGIPDARPLDAATLHRILQVIVPP